MLLLPSFTAQPERNRIYHTGALSLLKALGDESVDLFVMSPPYNLLNSSGNGFRWGKGGKWAASKFNHFNDGGYTIHDDNMPHDEYVVWQRACLKEMFRAIKSNGAIFYNHKWRVQGGLLQDRHDIVEGFPVRQIIIWDRGSGFTFNRRFFVPSYEVIYLICKPKFKVTKDSNSIRDVWRINPENNNPHAAPFPIEIPRRCIQATDAQLIVDPFMGSGTTAIAAQQLGRDYIGCDISLNYVEMARRRLAGKPLEPELAKQSTIFEALEAV